MFGDVPIEFFRFAQEFLSGHSLTLLVQYVKRLGSNREFHVVRMPRVLYFLYRICYRFVFRRLQNRVANSLAIISETVIESPNFEPSAHDSEPSACFFNKTKVLKLGNGSVHGRGIRAIEVCVVAKINGETR